MGSTPTRPGLLAAGVAAFLLAILAPAIKWLVVYIREMHHHNFHLE
jgi:hypothetical protein